MSSRGLDDRTANAGRPRRAGGGEGAVRALGARLAAAALAAAFLAAGCATVRGGDGLRRADDLLARGDWAGAAAAYHGALADGVPPADQERALLRLALIYALPESPLHEPARAEALLGRLAARGSAGPDGRAAALILAQERERRRLAADLAVESARADALAARLQAAESATAEAAGERAAAAESAEAKARQSAELRRRAGEIEVELARCREQVARLESELARLKAIDLERP